MVSLMIKSVNAREAWLDLLKGIGILFVVIGHIAVNEIREFIYLFHMPLFFLVSGYLYKPISVKLCINKKFNQLIIPYFSFLIFLSIPHFLKLILDLDFAGIKELMRDLLFGGVWLKGWFSVFWFVTCLFLVQQIYNLLFNYLNQNLLLLVIIFSCVFAYLNMLLFPDLYFFWGANIVFMALPLFYIGHLVRYKNLKKYLLSINCSFFSLIICGFLLYVIGIYPVDYKLANYGPFLIGLIISVLSVVILCSLSNILSKYKPFRATLGYLGTASFTIMFLHQPVQITLKYFDFTGLLFLTILTVVICVLCHKLFSLFGLTRFVFLGVAK